MKNTHFKKESLLPKLIALGALCVLAPTVAKAQDLEPMGQDGNLKEKLNTPSWTDETELKIGYVHENLDVDGAADRGQDGIALEANKDFALENGVKTTTAVIFKTTEDGEKWNEVDNTSISVMQRITKGYETNQMVLYPIIGAGVSYGSLEYGDWDGYDTEYASLNFEGTLKLDTMRGVAPYVSYTHQFANLEDTERDMQVQAVSAGLSFVF